MLIPSIDLKDGKVVQLVQGERLALASDDLQRWIDRFARFSRVQLIDLDAAMGSGDNHALVETVCRQLPCQVGGGIRTPDRALSLLGAGARKVIIGSSLFKDGRPNLELASLFAQRVGPERLIGAVDSRGGQVVIHGWKTTLPLTAADAVKALEPYCSEFLYTHVDTEGLMRGIPMDAVLEVGRATTRHLIAAGGITTQAEIDALDRAGIDAVVGMAIYTGSLSLEESPQSPQSRQSPNRQ
jgi:phosphoribosylformimino-5-aminoimidazole carboxamide ribotide isomerase